MLVARDNTFDQVDHNIGQITRNHANELSAWVRDKQRVTSSLKNAVDQPEAIAHTMAATAQQAGGFDDAYIVYADKRYIFNHAMPDGAARRAPGTSRPPRPTGRPSRRSMWTPRRASCA